jgi:hypothetical protein
MDVFQLNNSGYNLKSSQKRYMHLLKGVYSINQNCQEKKIHSSRTTRRLG